MNPLIILTFIAIFGLIIGSFLNVVIVRYPILLAQRWKQECLSCLKQPLTQKPQKYNVMTPRSHCLECQKKLNRWHNIPLISYLLLQGRCAYCKKNIATIYPIVELLTALVTVLVIYRFGLNWQGLAALFFSWSLIVLGFIDYQKQILPDDITLSILWLGLLCNAFFFYTTPSYAILGGLIGYLLLWSVAKLFRIIRRKNGMGHGDFKMLAMLGAWCGLPILLNIVLTSTLIALIISFLLIVIKKISQQNPIAFGPYLAIGGWLSFIDGNTLTDWITGVLQNV